MNFMQGDFTLPEMSIGCYILTELSTGILNVAELLQALAELCAG